MHYRKTALRATLAAVALAMLAACRRSDTFVFEGRFKGIGDAQFYLYAPDAFDGIDTLRLASDGSFSYERPLDGPTVLTLLYPNFSTTLVVAEPGARVRLEADASHLAEVRVEGTPENEALSRLRRDLSGLGADAARGKVAAFVRANPAMTASPALVRKYFLEAESIVPDTLAALIAMLERGGARGTPALRADAAALLPPVGKVAPVEVGLADGRRRTFPVPGRPAVVYFWATWNHESVMGLDGFAAFSRRRAGEADFLCVALDENSRRARQKLERDSLLACGVADGRAFAGPAVESFGLRRVPQALYIDAGGRVRATAANPEELEKHFPQKH